MPRQRSLARAAARAWTWFLVQLRARDDAGAAAPPRGGLRTLFRQDRLLLWATGVMSLCALVPLGLATFLPFGDLPDTAACAALIPEILWGKGLPAEVYSVQWAFVPYWTTTVIIAVVSSIAGVLVATKVLVGLIVLLIPLATMRLLLALGRDPRLGLLAFALSYDHNLYGGWVAYLLGMCMAFWALAWLIEANTFKAMLPVALLGALIGLTHAQATLTFVAATVALTAVRRNRVRALALHATAGLGVLIVFGPWLLRLGGGSTGGASTLASSLTANQDPLGEKLRDLFRFTLDNYTREADVHASARTFALLLFGPVVLGLLPNKPGAARGAALVLFLVLGALYVATPMATGGPASQWYVYPRFATFLLLSLLLLPRPDLSGWRAAWLAPGLLVILAFHVRVAAQFHDWDKRTRPFLDLVHLVRKNARTLPLEMVDYDPAVKWGVYNQLHAYVAAMRSGYSPHMWHHVALPFQYRPDKDVPSTGSVGGGTAFELEKYGGYYDYILVQGKTADPVHGHAESKSFRAQVVGESEVFRLYSIERRAPPAPAPR